MPDTMELTRARHLKALKNYLRFSISEQMRAKMRKKL